LRPRYAIAAEVARQLFSLIGDVTIHCLPY
jgi:hypothetical protein